MSKRYGRKQKRRHRAVLAEANQRIRHLEGLRPAKLEQRCHDLIESIMTICPRSAAAPPIDGWTECSTHKLTLRAANHPWDHQYQADVLKIPMGFIRVWLEESDALTLIHFRAPSPDGGVGFQYVISADVMANYDRLPFVRQEVRDQIDQALIEYARRVKHEPTRSTRQ